MIDLTLPDQELSRRLSSATEVVRAMAVTEQNKALLAMVDAMACIYTNELIHSDAEPTKRMVIRQLLQLRRVLVGEEHSSALI